MDGEFGVSRNKPLHLKWISNGVLLYSTENNSLEYIHSLAVKHDGKQYEKKNVYIWMTGSLCYSRN